MLSAGTLLLDRRPVVCCVQLTVVNRDVCTGALCSGRLLIRLLLAIANRRSVADWVELCTPGRLVVVHHKSSLHRNRSNVPLCIRE